VQHADDERTERAERVPDALDESAQRDSALVRSRAHVDEHERQREEQRTETGEHHPEPGGGRGSDDEAEVADREARDSGIDEDTDTPQP
jgi:hypothetical protein